jgi:ElaB/YqjD/DUF883 family membrane-anchored ribosome-binding protein
VQTAAVECPVTAGTAGSGAHDDVVDIREATDRLPIIVVGDTILRRGDTPCRTSESEAEMPPRRAKNQGPAKSCKGKVSKGCREDDPGVAKKRPSPDPHRDQVKSQLPCKFFAGSGCKKGAKCKFSHAQAVAEQITSLADERDGLRDVIRELLSEQQQNAESSAAAAEDEARDTREKTKMLISEAARQIEQTRLYVPWGQAVRSYLFLGCAVIGLLLMSWSSHYVNIALWAFLVVLDSVKRGVDRKLLMAGAYLLTFAAMSHNLSLLMTILAIAFFLTATLPTMRFRYYELWEFKEWSVVRDEDLVDLRPMVTKSAKLEFPSRLAVFKVTKVGPNRSWWTFFWKHWQVDEFEVRPDIEIYAHANVANIFDGTTDEPTAQIRIKNILFLNSKTVAADRYRTSPVFKHTHAMILARWRHERYECRHLNF